MTSNGARQREVLRARDGEMPGDDYDVCPDRVVLTVSGIGTFELNENLTAHGLGVPGGLVLGALRGVHLGEGIAFATIQSEHGGRCVVPFCGVTPIGHDEWLDDISRRT